MLGDDFYDHFFRETGKAPNLSHTAKEEMYAIRLNDSYIGWVVLQKDEQGRPDVGIKLMREYSRTDHERADNMEACNVIDAVLGVVICKNLFLCNRQRTKFYLLMMPGDKSFRTKELSRQIGSSRLSFAEPEDMMKCLDIEPGAVSIMGLMNDKEKNVQLLIDEDVLKEEDIGCHPCVCTSSLKMKTADVIEKFLPATGHG